MRRHEADGTETIIPLKQHQFPSFSWALPVFGPPAICCSETVENCKASDKLHGLVSRWDAENALALGGGSAPVSMSPMPYNGMQFKRFLAKVAHAFACATVGASNFKPLLIDAILTNSTEPRLFVGGSGEIEPAEDYVFEITLGSLSRATGGFYLAVRFRILSYLGTPTYWLAVGEDFSGEPTKLPNTSFSLPMTLKVTYPMEA